MSHFNVKSVPFWTVYEGEGASPPPPPPVSPPPPPPPAEDVPTLTQKQVNDLLAKERKKANEQTQQAIVQLEAAKRARGLTEQEKETLSKQIDELNKTMLTKEELAAREKKTLEEKYKLDLDDTSKRAKNWENKYAKAEIKRTIFDEAKAANSVDEDQIVEMLEPKARLVQVTDADGKPVDEYEPKVTVKVEKEGKTVQLDVTVKEAIKLMKENPRFGNLFKDTKAGGLGAGRSGESGRSGGGKNPADMPTSEYRKWRKENVRRN